MKKTATSAFLLAVLCWCATDALAQRPELPPGHPLHRLQEGERTEPAHPRFRSPADTARHALIPGRDGIPRFTDTYRSTGDENWDERFGMAGVDGHVNATAVDASGNLYVGGWFTTAGNTPARSIAMWDGSTWSALGSGISGEVLSLAIDAAGNVYAGGWIYLAGGVPVNNIARWNGSTWAPLGAGVYGDVYALALDASGHLYAGGWFWQAGGSNISYIARWDGASWHPLGSGLNEGVAALATGTDGSIYAGGWFTTAGGVTVNRVSRWSGSAWHALGTGIGGSDWPEVLALTVDEAGHLYAGGHFQTAGGVTAHNVARWNGTTWSAVGTSSYWDGYVFDLAANRNGILYAGGWFSQLPGASTSHIGRWNGTSWSPLGSGTDGAVRALTVGTNDDLFAGGWFTTAGGIASNAIAEWSAGSWLRLGEGHGLNGPVWAIVKDGHGNVYVGGSFTAAGSVAANSVARWDGESWEPLGGGLMYYDWAPGYVYALAIDAAGNVYAGGEFTTAGGVPARNIARWNGSAWSALGTGIGTEYHGWVNALATDAAGNLYAGGSFSQAGASNVQNVARWNGALWSGLGSGVSGQVLALEVEGHGDLYAGGWFWQAGNVSANNVARWNGSAWSALGSGTDNPVLTLATDPAGNLYAGGVFDAAGGVPASKIAVWDSSQWSPLGDGVGGPGVAALVPTPEGGLYAGGLFTEAGGTAAMNIAFWDGGGWSALGSGVNSTVRALGVDGESVYVGGYFNQAGSTAASHFARWERTVGLYTMAGARAAGPGATVTVEGTVSRARGRAAYFQDHTGGLMLFEQSGLLRDAITAGTVAGGTTLRVTGTLSDDDGMLQIADTGLAEWEILGQGAPPPALTRTLSHLAASAPGTYQSRLVRVYGGWFEPPGGTFAAGTAYLTSDPSLEPQTFPLFVPDATESSIPGSTIPEYQFEFNGVIGHGSGTGAHLLAIEQSDIRAILPPALAFEPEDGLEVTTDAGTVASATVTLTNTGEQPMSFAFTQFADAVRQPRPSGTLERILLDRGEVDPRPGFFGRDQGGPDGFGYSWIDSNEPGGPSFNWVDIAATGTPLVLGVDQVRYVPLPFSFPFYDGEYTTVGICSNGFLEFGGGDGWCEYIHQPMPSSWWPNNLIAPYWTDLNPQAGGAVYYRDMGDGRFVVQYQDVPRYFSHGSYTFQVILYHNGAMLFQYGALSEPTEWASIGIENQDGSDGLQIAFNTPYAHSGLAVRIAAIPPFVTGVEPASGSLAPGASMEVLVHFDATTLYDGLYEASLAVQTDEQDYNVYSYPVALTVIGEADCGVVPDPISFGGTIVGASATRVASIVNAGTAACAVLDMTIDGDDFSSAFVGNLSVPPAHSVPFEVVFAPSSVGTVVGSLVIATDGDPIVAGLEGIGLAPPIASIDPGELAFTVPVNGTASGGLLLSNLADAGAADLGFTVYAVAARAHPLLSREVAVERSPSDSRLRTREVGPWPTSYIDAEESPAARYRGNEVTITHSLSQQVLGEHGIACLGATTRIMRLFDLSSFNLSGGLEITSIDLGLEAIWDPVVTSVRLHRLQGAFVMANLTLLAQVPLQLSWDHQMSIINVPIEASLAQDDVLVVEWYLPPTVFFGGNNGGQTGPTYVQADDCSIPEPTDLGAIGFPWAHWVLNVHGTTGPGMISITPTEGWVVAGASEELTVTVNAEAAEHPSYNFELLFETNDPSNPLMSIPVSVSVTGINIDEPGSPLVFALHQNYPNPFSRETIIDYALAASSTVRIDVYDALGRKVATLVDAELPAGRHSVRWDAQRLAGGPYFYRITADSFSSTMRALVVR